MDEHWDFPACSWEVLIWNYPRWHVAMFVPFVNVVAVQDQTIHWAVLSDEQMSNGWPFSLLNDEQMSNWVGVEHEPVQDRDEVSIYIYIYIFFLFWQSSCADQTKFSFFGVVVFGVARVYRMFFEIICSYKYTVYRVTFTPSLLVSFPLYVFGALFSPCISGTPESSCPNPTAAGRRDMTKKRRFYASTVQWVILSHIDLGGVTSYDHLMFR